MKKIKQKTWDGVVDKKSTKKRKVKDVKSY